MNNTTTINNPVATITDRHEHHTEREAVMLDLIQSVPNSRSNHFGITVHDIDVYNLPYDDGANVFIDTPDMETYLHIVSVVTREAAENGYSVDVYQNGWNVQFKITVPMTVAS